MSARSAVSVPLEGAKRFILVLHDVTPEVRQICDRGLDELAAAGARCASLIVAPRTEHRAAPPGKSIFTEWLARLAQRGYDICLNGFEYIAVHSRSRSFLSALIGSPCDKHNFFCIREDEALAKLKDGMKFFRDAGIEVSAFHAPAWDMSEQARQAVVNTGIRCNLASGHLDIMEYGNRLKAPALKTSPTWQTRPYAHRFGTCFWRWTTRSLPIVRISARMADIEDSETCALLKDLIQKLSSTRQASTCRDITNLFGMSSG